MKTATAASSYGAPKVFHVNPDWAKLPLFDRSKWQRGRFGDVVANMNETERDPAGAGIERFIAMEHLEPGSLHVLSQDSVRPCMASKRSLATERPGRCTANDRTAPANSSPRRQA